MEHTVEGSRRLRLSLSHPDRIRARDLKLYNKDEERAAREGIARYRCPCNLCGGRKRPCSRKTIFRHYESRGRHGALRGWIEGDTYDSSDEEWEATIGQNARAFLGLQEPIREISLDGGLGVQRMVRDALQRADEIHCAAMQILEDMSNTHDHVNAHSPAREPVELSERVHTSMDSDESVMDVNDDDMFEDAHDNLEHNFGDAMSSDTSEDSHVDDEEDDLEEFLDRIPDGCLNENATIEIAGTLPLFEGASLSMLSATLLIINCCRTHGVSNAFMNELLMLLCMSILPAGNVLPKSEYEASKMLKFFGLAYDIIHACPKGCILFRGEFEAHDNCPECGSSRYRQCGRSTVPALVLRHFPLIPRLKRMFASKKLSELNVWHFFNRSEDGKMRHTADSPQWKFVDTELEPEDTINRFGSDPRHLHLGMALDGFNPWSEKRSTDSMWPVMFLNYNLPLWLVTKKYFVMLYLLIPTKVSVTGHNFDVFLQPAIDELQQLWKPEGVHTKDARGEDGAQHFGLRACVMWTMHDFPGYGLVSGLMTKGFKACPVCGPSTVSRYSKVLRKVVYCNCHRRYLEANHYFRGDFAAFDYGAELEREVKAMSGNETIRNGRASERFLREEGNDRHENFPGKQHGVKRVLALFQLPYWRKLPFRNLLDVMHIEKNICEGLLKLLMGITDTTTSRRDMEEERIKPHLWVRRDVEDGHFLKPTAPYVLTKEEHKILLDQIVGISVPTGYCGDLKKHILKNKLGNMKSHDFHILLQFILPMCLRHLMNPGPRTAIIRLGRLFTMLCKKVLNVVELERLQVYVAETMCLLEVWFPPSAFDIMWHLPIHLVQQIKQCGPVANTWCYPIERHMGFFKKYIRKRSRPEACIANAYMYEEALGFCTEYFKLYAHTKRRVWDDDEEPCDSGEHLMGAAEEKVLSIEEHRAIHYWIIRNSIATAEPWRLYNEEQEALEMGRQVFRTEAARRGLSRRHQHDYPANLRDDMPHFVEWLSNYTTSLIRTHGVGHVDLELRRLSKLPSVEVESYKHMWAYGNHFRVEEEIGQLGYVTQDYGIACVFGVDEERSAGVSMVGILKDIIVVRYSARRRVVMQGSWIWSTPSERPSTKIDEYGFTVVHYNDRIAGGREPYVLPATVRQVFFVDDWRHPGWKIVLQKEPRSRRVVDDEDEQILGISGTQVGLELPHNLNAPEFRPRIRIAGDTVLEAEIARLNMLVNGMRPRNVTGQARRRRRRLRQAR